MINLSKEDINYLNRFGITISKNQVTFKQAFSSTKVTLNFSTVKEIFLRKSIIPIWVKVLSTISKVFSKNKYSDDYFENNALDYEYSYDVVFLLKDTHTAHKKIEHVDLFKLKKIITRMNDQLM